jgi:hypothetical protein
VYSDVIARKEGFVMAMEIKEVIGVIIVIALAAAGILDILLVLIIDKLGGVIDSLDRINASLNLMRNDTLNIAETFDYGLSVKFEEPDELE